MAAVVGKSFTRSNQVSIQGVVEAAITIGKARSERLHVIRKRCEERQYGPDFIDMVREFVGLQPDQRQAS